MKLKKHLSVLAITVSFIALAMFNGCGRSGGGVLPSVSGKSGIGKVSAKVTLTNRVGGRVVAADTETVTVDIEIRGWYSEDNTSTPSPML